ncbi:MAG: hypothetical protein K0Q66_2437 [Chitinophagaceae bacterium]|nr:hypothetical protein [Chitinophagaceae bacterium]
MVITLEPFFHRNEEGIALHFTHNHQLNDIIKKLPRARWSRSHGCWYIPCTRVDYERLAAAVKEVAQLDATALKAYLAQKKALIPSVNSKIRQPTAQLIISNPLNGENIKAMVAFRNMLQLKAYSVNTIRNYCNELHHLLRLLGGRCINDLGKEQVMSYLLWMLEKKGCSETRVHTAVNAIKFYFEHVLGRQKEFYDLPRPKKPSQLPAVLADTEVVGIIQNISNLKHRTIVMAGYSAGLRVSEIVNLRSGMLTVNG